MESPQWNTEGLRWCGSIYAPPKEYSVLSWDATAPLLYTGNSHPEDNGPGSIEVWNAEDVSFVKEFHKEQEGIFRMTLSPDGKKMAIVTEKGLQIRYVTSKRPLWRLPIFAEGLAWSPDSKILAVCCDELPGALGLFKARTGKVIHKPELDVGGIHHPNPAWHPSGKIVFFTDGGYINRLDVESGEITRLFENEDTKNITELAWFPLQEALLTNRLSQGFFRVWEPVKETILHTNTQHDRQITGLSCSGDGRLCATKSWDQSIRLWDCRTLEEVARLPHECQSYCSGALAFHPNLPYLATSDEDSTRIHIWMYDCKILLQEKG